MPRPCFLNIEILRAFQSIMTPARYRVWYGGRGAGKSWCVARLLLARAYAKKMRILCAREFQVSIADSVHRLLSDQISALGLNTYFKITKTSIVSYCGSEFIFKGIRHNVTEIKSLEGIDVCWVEEAHHVSKDSWNVLIPTIRKQDSEIWITFNPDLEADETYQRFVINTPPETQIRKINYDENPWFPETLRQEMEYCQRVDIEAHDNIWMGNPRTISDAVVFKGKYQISRFNAAEGTCFFYGADWGFSQDPTVLIRCFVMDRMLYIDHEAWGIGVEIDQTPRLFEQVPESRKGRINADNARPETISAMLRYGFNIGPARKWPGSVEDGIAFIRQFECVCIHERCTHTIDEFKRYSYKTDRTTGAALTDLVDAHNHCIDALRYAIDDYIRAGSVLKIPDYSIGGMSRRFEVV